MNIQRTRPNKRTGGLAAAAAMIAIGLAGCGGGHATPHVANLGTSRATTGGAGGAGSTATTLPTGNATELLDEWAACMRSHGDPGQADPVVTANKVIDIVGWSPATPGGIYGTEKGGVGNDGPGQYCRSYLSAAVQALQSGEHQEHPSQAQLRKYSECMRANGIPDFPDPGADGSLTFSVNATGDLNPNNPTFLSTSKLCAQKTGVPGLSGAPSQPGMVEINGSGPGGAGG